MLNKQLLVTSLLLVLLFVGILALRSGRIFSIQKVTCDIDQTTPCPDYVQAELNKNIGQSIFSSDIMAELLKISTYVPSLHQFHFQQHLPDKLAVHFTSAQEKYAVRQATASAYFIIDETGTVVNQEQQTSLPIVTFSPELYNGLTLRASINQDIHQAIVGMLNEVDAHRVPLTQITILNQDEATLELEDGKIAQVSLATSALAVDKLAYIIDNVNFTTVKQPVKIIDLRFRYPVLKT